MTTRPVMPEPWLVVDLQALQNPRHPDRGIARYVRELSRALVALAPEVVRFVYNPRAAAPDPADPLFAAAPAAPNRPGGPDGAPRGDPFLYLVPSPFEEWLGPDEIWPRWVRTPRALTAVTLHDLIPLRFPEHYFALPGFRAAYEPRLALVRDADLVLANSECTAGDAIELLGLESRRVVTIGGGVSEFWTPPRDPAEAFREAQAGVPGLRPGFLLFTGGIEFRKNMEGTLAGYATVPPDVRRAHPLVITCRMDAAQEDRLRSVARAHGLAADTLFTNFVPDDVLRALYRSTDLFVFPSLYEGFGLPVAEAMACGAPAIVADRSSLREIVTRPEARFDPDRPAAIGGAIAGALADVGLRAVLRTDAAGTARRFTWRAVAERTLAACRAAHEARLRRRRAVAVPRAHRPTLALLSPMPPEPSGVADYSLGLVRALEPHADVDVFVGGDPARFAAPGTRGTQVLHHTTFPLLDALGRYDEVIYVMGNSAHHAFVYDALRARPGVVLAHEVRLTGFYSWYGAHRRLPRFLADAIRAQHPAAPAAIAQKGLITAEEADAHGIRLVAEILERSTRFLVHSRFAADIVRRERPDLAPRVHVVHFGAPEPIASGPRREPVRPPIVATFGIVSQLKRVDRFLKAARLVADRVEGVRFAIVGPVETREAAELRARADSLGLRDRLEITGRVDRRTYEDWLARASCAVQLRASTNGECSAAIADCLGAALPTLVSDIGPMRELPGAAVRLLPADADEAALAAAIAEILLHPEVATALSREAWQFARRSGFGPAALSLLRAIDLPLSAASAPGSARDRLPTPA